MLGIVAVIANNQNHFASKASVNFLDTVPQVIGVDRTVDTTVFTKVDVEASVNMFQWTSHLERNLGPVINKAAKKGMPVGMHTINTRFLVEKDGRVTYAVVLNDPGYGVGEGILKIFRTAPRWTPGSLNGKPVRSYHTQPVTFIITEK